MTPTDKILKQFDERFPDLGATDPKEGRYDARPEVKSFLKESIAQAEQEGYKRGVKAVELPTHDHLKCPIRETCIGYQSAESDLQNVKEALLASLNRPVIE